MFFYDFLRISRRIMPRSDFFVNLEDAVFVGLCSGAVFYLTYLKNSGELRVQTVLGLMIGCFGYFFLIKNRFLRVGLKFVKLIFKIVKITMYPFVIVLRIFIKPARVIVWYTGRSFKSIHNRAELKIRKLRHILRKR